MAIVSPDHASELDAILKEGMQRSLESFMKRMKTDDKSETPSSDKERADKSSAALATFVMSLAGGAMLIEFKDFVRKSLLGELNAALLPEEK